MLLALHLVLAILWAMATGGISLVNLLVGFLIGGLVLHFAGPALGDARYAVRAYRLTALFGFFLRELLVSSVRVAVDVLRPRLTMIPAVVAVPLDLRDELQITLLANLVSLTPGTLSIDVAEDRRTLYVHAMYGQDPERLRREIKQSFERRIQEAFR
jgi:multicomponent Na+:H+ antiporter subunit E